MRTKDEILSELHNHTLKLDPQHKELAMVAIIETEIQIDIRDLLQGLFNHLSDISETLQYKT